MALNGSKQDEEGYLVWVETDQEGRILDRVRGRNLGMMNRKEFEKRDDLGESFERDDGLKVRVSDTWHSTGASKTKKATWSGWKPIRKAGSLIASEEGTWE